MLTHEPGEPPFSAALLDPWSNAEPPSVEIAFGARDDITRRLARTANAVFGGPTDPDWVEPDLAVAALVRGVAGLLEQSDADVTACSLERPPGNNVRSAATLARLALHC